MLRWRPSNVPESMGVGSLWEVVGTRRNQILFCDICRNTNRQEPQRNGSGPGVDDTGSGKPRPPCPLTLKVMLFCDKEIPN